MRNICNYFLKKAMFLCAFFMVLLIGNNVLNAQSSNQIQEEFSQFVNQDVIMTFEEIYPYELDGDNVSHHADITIESPTKGVLISQGFNDVKFVNNQFRVTINVGSELFRLNEPDLFFSIKIFGFSQVASYNLYTIPRVFAAKRARRVLNVDAEKVEGIFAGDFVANRDFDVVKDGASLLTVKNQFNRVGIGTTQPQVALDVNGTMNMKDFRIQGELLRDARSWKALVDSGKESIVTTKTVTVGPYQKTPIDLNVRSGTVNVSELFKGGVSFFEARTVWATQNRVVKDRFGQDVQVELLTAKKNLTDKRIIDNVGIGQNKPETKLDISGGVRIATWNSVFSHIPTGGVVEFSDQKFLGYFPSGNILGEAIVSRNLLGISGIGNPDTFSFFDAQDPNAFSSTLSGDSEFSILSQNKSGFVSLISLFKDNLVDDSLKNEVLMHFKNRFEIDDISIASDVVTINIKPKDDFDDQVVIARDQGDDSIFNISFFKQGVLTSRESVGVDDDSLRVPDKGNFIVGINDIDDESFVTIKPNDNQDIVKVSSENVIMRVTNSNFGDASKFLVGKDSSPYTVDVKNILNVTNLYKNGLSFSTAFASGTYWVLNKVDDIESVYYDYGRVSIGSGPIPDKTLSGSLLHLIQTPGLGQQIDPLDNQDVGIVFALPGGIPYIVGVDAGSVLLRDGQPVRDKFGNTKINEVFRVQRGTDLNESVPLFTISRSEPDANGQSEGKLGVGVNQPESNFHVSGNIGMVLSGKFDIDTKLDTPENLTESMFFFQPDRASFRVGRIGSFKDQSPKCEENSKNCISDQEVWASKNIGFYSIGMGSNSMPSGNFSTIIGGVNNMMVGPYSTSLGGRENYTDGFFNLIVGQGIRTNHKDTTKVIDNYGTFVWSDGAINNPGDTIQKFSSRYNNQFLINAFNGVGFNTNKTEIENSDGKLEKAMFTLGSRVIIVQDFIPMLEKKLDILIDDVYDSGTFPNQNKILFYLAGRIYRHLVDLNILEQIVNKDTGKSISSIVNVSDITLLNESNLSLVFNSFDTQLTTEVSDSISTLGLNINDNTVKDLVPEISSFLSRMAELNGVEIFDRLGNQINTVVTNKGQLVLGANRANGANLRVAEGDMALGVDEVIATLDVQRDFNDNLLFIVHASSNTSLKPGKSVHSL